MDFDFRAEYARRPSGELLDIVATPEKYQAAALGAAREVLAARGVDVNAYLADRRQAAEKAAADRATRSVNSSLRGLKVTIFDEPVEAPPPDPAAVRILNAFLIFLLIIFAVRLVFIGRWIFYLLRYWGSTGLEFFGYGDLFAVALLTAFGLGIFLLYRRDRRGWVLLAVLSMLSLMQLALSIAVLIIKDYADEIWPAVSSAGLYYLAMGLTLLGLMRNDMRSLLEAHQDLVKRTTLWTAAAAVMLSIATGVFS